MSRLLLLLLLGGTASAAEPSLLETRQGCPSAPAVEAPVESVAVPGPLAAPAAFKAPEAPPATEPRSRQRPRGAVWHSFLPGIFK
jgi:hypothetical protein